jgi:hypothetical protein
LEVAGYNSKSGCIFLRNVIAVFANYGHEMPVTQLLEEVANRVIKQTVDTNSVNAPMFHNVSMRKNFFFFPRPLLYDEHEQ